MFFRKKPAITNEEFPILDSGLVYLDNACMTLKPKRVVEAITSYYRELSSCGGRAQYRLSKKVQQKVEETRQSVASFIGSKPSEIVFTKNTTEAINLVSRGLKFKRGDEIIVSDKEHNSNFLPWLRLQEQGVKIRVLDSSSDNSFDYASFEKALNPRVKLVALVHISNLDGAYTDIARVVSLAKKYKALVLFDCAQSASHIPINVHALDVDFIACSGHKLCGPTGTGFLYGKRNLLEQLQPLVLGGGTVTDVSVNDYQLERVPARFEAGLQDYAGIIALKSAIEYLTDKGFPKIQEQVNTLTKKVLNALTQVDGLTLIGSSDPEERNGIISFNLKGMDSHEVALLLDSAHNISVRSGAHCVHAWFNKHKLSGCVRASFHFYNTESDADKFIQAIQQIASLSKK